MDIPVIDLTRYLEIADKLSTDPVKLSRQLGELGPGLVNCVGVTPEGVEVPRSLVDEEMQEELKAMPKEFQPSTPKGPDRKWRYMWRAVAEMAAIGFGLPKDAFTSIMKQGPHLLAPTGSDLGCYGQEGTVFAGYHYDLNFLTIHGRSRFPGLNIWLRNGQKVGVKVPLGCLLIQTGKQIEWLTAGDCIAGMHEVVVTKRTIDAVKLASEQNCSLWRVSSTLFAHIASDAVLKPLGHFAESPLASKYPPIRAGEFVEQELSGFLVAGREIKFKDETSNGRAALVSFKKSSG
ncbi:hypothetical protein GH714_015786 [Hevea brasiliensis]|uniref:Isopenicillin N synthase-like Fe(2+) 2OG dioxygenase domain-containing protein n=1 Tax=Hevea brasiliensis TaxID=3981 RepID=A0A6A6N4M2_HEVBR|nr:hypothetical protein GH714_015786 [Hevea brasiliensis]